MDDNTAHLVNGTDINLCEETRVSPLRTACKIVHDSTVYNLNNEWCRFNLCEENGTSPCLIGCQEGQYGIVQH